MRLWQAAETLVLRLLVAEVAGSRHAATLFRGTTPATRCFERLLRRTGADYLRRVLGGVVADLARGPPPVEIDPALLPRGQSAAANGAALAVLFDDLVTALAASPAHMPAPVRAVLAGARRAAAAQFPDKADVGHTAVSAFLVLRFLAPALAGPELYGLAPLALPAEGRRAAMLLSKILQSLANFSRRRCAMYSSYVTFIPSTNSHTKNSALKAR
jgi:hypothetical protein